MFPFSIVFIVVGVALILFGIRFALDLGAAAQRQAERHRALGDPLVSMRDIRGRRHHSYRPQSTTGMRLAGCLYVFVGALFILFSIVFASFPGV